MVWSDAVMKPSRDMLMSNTTVLMARFYDQITRTRRDSA
jgi:hypothetical protein